MDGVADRMGFAMAKWFGAKWSGWRPGAETRPPDPSLPFPALPSPDEALCLVGDIHGRADLLDLLLALRAEAFPQTRLICLGDMIDRGPDSAGVLRRLRAEQARGAVCLAGNHEAMLLAFLDAPEAGQGWLAHGGFGTLASFGVFPARGEDAPALRDRLRAAMDAGLETWLRGLPLWWQSGDLVATHAGMDPALPPGIQGARVLQWGHGDFTRHARPDGLWVAYGHVIRETALAEGGRIALDTGAWATGRLSYARIDPARAGEDRLVLGAVS